ncbi:hypothetical protein TRSC58_05894 [Trypanosoma rangeli SC58]|uniref:Uncharacterized protein n=1 Tax=Trypanosoma rangeli SC58 TaxID=429131 RepID=A0A061ITR2_TRYRA|nr:hypothetical protein TRSC58_05894 [Trypanosoma rangeli SC58]
MSLQTCFVRRGSSRSRPIFACFARCVVQHARRLHGTQPTPWQSEDRVASWCCRLWGLKQGRSCDSTSTSLQSSTRSSTSFRGSPSRGLLGEVLSQTGLAEELKAVMVGEKGRLPESVVESVWDVYGSIIPPVVASDIARLVTPTQEEKFFEFVGLLAELDINLAGLKAETEKLTRCIGAVETLLAGVQRGEAKDGPAKGGGGAAVSDAAALSEELVTAKNDLLRQCVAIRHAGSPVHYLWLRQSASLERGMLRLMDLRRCVTYFKGRCRERLAALQDQTESGGPKPFPQK